MPFRKGGGMEIIMYKLDFNNKVHIYFIGIGGISMSGFAELLHKEGFTVSGSDSQKNNITTHLESLGINIFYGQNEKNITKMYDLVVYTAAIHEDNPEYKKAMELGIPMLNRAQMVGQVMKNYSNAIAVSGTHGKTTTTSMLSMMMLAGDLDPTISVGGILEAIHGNIRIGNSENFITEACEYTDSFLNFHPTRSIILNVEAEHLDYFKDLEQVRNSFKTFANLLPEDGVLVINGEIEQVSELISKVDAKIYTYGVMDQNYEQSFDISARNINYDEFGCGTYDLFKKETKLATIKLRTVGRHNISNSLAAIAMALDMGISIEAIQEALNQFTGTHRRFEYKGQRNGVTIIDDYAHHPTEIEACLDGAKRYPHKELWVAFQPHTYTRTKNFLKEFAIALSMADHIVLADIYAAREQDPGDISSADLKKELELLGKDVQHFHTFEEIEKFLIHNCTNGDLLITMGAGNIVSIGESLLSK